MIKAIAMDERTKDKDAYDIAFVLKHYKPSLADLAKKVRGVSQTGIGKEALELLRGKFRTFDSVGPVWAGRAASTAGKTQYNFNVRHTKTLLSFSDGSMRFEPPLPHVLLTR